MNMNIDEDEDEIEKNCSLFMMDKDQTWHIII